MDKAAIFADVTRRNALRKAIGLPLLDVHNEYAHQVAIAAQQDFRVVCDEHAGEREAIRQQVLAELRAQHGPNFGQSMGGRWAVGHLAHKRFIAYMASRHGIALNSKGSARNAITYGETATKE